MKDPFTELIKESDIDLKMWNRIKWTFISILLLVLSIYLINETSKGNCSPYYDSINEEYTGKVVAKYWDENNHMNETVELENKRITINPFDKSAYFDSIEIGDVVVKNRGSLTYFIVRENDTLAFENTEADCKKYLTH
ncbi:MAG: hypothetical protein K0S23_311 [Fluviicola sp.]|jgi:hypothetical protein|uniref:hypothetical protein n=1 Tax=Fluviicola sp. TaxID=1917219 RepID=UPI00261D85C8|nr:hypothetical protein [Fluviicola sp.]MDF3026004.1 hypothetical protein [Fluviicola sp.]